MKKIFSILLLLFSTISFSQNLGNPAVIGQSTRNQKVGKGFQVEDTLLAKGKVRFSVISTASTKDTFVMVVDTSGYVSEIGKSTFLAGIGGTVDTSTIATKAYTNALAAQKQNTLVSGNNLKTVNNQTLLGSTNISTSLYIRNDWDSIRVWINGTTDTVVFGYAVRSIALNGGGDSIIFYIGNTRGAIKISTSSSSSLSGLTAATATNNINNVSYGQWWQWNSITADTAMKISSTSTGALTGQTMIDVSTSGALAAGQNTFGINISNTKSSAGGIGIALRASCTTSGGFAADFNGDVRITAGYSLYFGNASRIYNNTSGGNLTVEAPTSGGLFLISKSTGGVTFGSSSSVVYAGLPNISSTNQSLILGGDHSGVFRSVGTSATVIKRETGKLILCANTGLGGGYAGYTPSEIVTINGSTTEALGNVGIGTNAPVASAKLEITSTTMGFLPPRMTATQASAISSPAQGLMLFVTDTDATFLSIGWWGYNGSAWEKLNN